MTNFLDYLTRVESTYQHAEVKTDNDFQTLPDGKYVAIIDWMELSESKTSGRPQLVWVFLITEGPHQGRKVWKYNGLDTPDKIGYLKNDLHKAGLPLKSILGLQTEIRQLIGRKLEIRLKTKETPTYGKMQNVYINKVISQAKPASPERLDLPF
jgi:hypothetical protein